MIVVSTRTSSADPSPDPTSTAAGSGSAGVTGVSFGTQIEHGQVAASATDVPSTTGPATPNVTATTTAVDNRRGRRRNPRIVRQSL